MELGITQQESIWQRTNSVNYTDLSKTEIAQYNSQFTEVTDS